MFKLDEIFYYNGYTICSFHIYNLVSSTFWTFESYSLGAKVTWKIIFKNKACNLTITFHKHLDFHLYSSK